MDRHLSPTLFAADFADVDATTTPAFAQSTAKDVGFDEGWLQEAIARNPELVIAPCREAKLTDEAWAVWGREVRVGSAGTVDVLLVSESARIGLVETKLSYNPESRRSVVAQTLEYAIHFPQVDPADLPPMPAVDRRPFADMEDVRTRVEDGDYLLVIAGDLLDGRAVKLGRTLLGRHLVHGWDLAMVEVSVYRPLPVAPAGPVGRCLLVPHIRGAIVPEGRQVVRIKVDGDRNRVTVDHAAPVTDVADVDPRYVWDQARFEANVRANNPHMADAVRRLIDLFKRFGTFEWKSADFKGTLGKLNFMFPALCTKPLFRLYAEDGTLALHINAPDKSAAVKASRRAVVERLCAAGFCQPPTEGASDVIDVDFPQWSAGLDTLEAVLAQTPAR